jgi:hypothetical protein
MKMVCAWMSLMLAAVPAAVWAQAYYVDSGAGGGGDGRSIGSPWASIDDVNNHSFETGDDLSFKRGGSYLGVLRIRWSGTQSDTAVIGSYGDANEQEPILRGVNGNENVITINNKEYITIEDLSIEGNGRDYGIYVENTANSDMDQIKISNVKLKNLNKSAVYFSGVIGGTVENCTITASGDEDDSNRAALHFSQSGRLEIIGNLIKDIPRHGIYIRLTNASQGTEPNCILRDNHFVRVGKDNPSAANVSIENADDILIQSNLICCRKTEQNLKGLELLRGSDGQNSKPIIVMGNMMSNCTTAVSIGNSQTKFDGIKLFNNTLKHCTRPIQLLGSFTGSDIKNNIFYQYRQQSTAKTYSGDVEWDYNLWYPGSPELASIRGDHDVTGDPRFVSGGSTCESAQAFRLAEGSPAFGERFTPNGEIASLFHETCPDPGSSWFGWCVGADCCSTPIVAPDITGPQNLKMNRIYN